MLLRFKLAGNDEPIEVETGSARLSDEVAFEHEFGISSAVISVQELAAARHNVAVLEAIQAGEEPPEPTDAIYPRTEWIAFFGYRALKREGHKVAASFADFLDSVDEFAVLIPDDDEDDKTDPDPELVGEDIAAGGSGLDPTVRGQRPTPQRS